MMETDSPRDVNRESAKLLRVDSPPDYIPTLSSSAVDRHINSQSPQPNGSSNALKQWGRIKNVAQIRSELTEQEPSDEGDATFDEHSRELPMSIGNFQQAAQVIINSRRALKRSRCRSGKAAQLISRSNSFKSTNAEADMFMDYNLVNMHHRIRRQRQLKLALLQKQFIDQLPSLTEKSVKENLKRRLEVLELIRNSGLLSDQRSSSDGSRPNSDQPVRIPQGRRQRRLRRSIDNTNCPMYTDFEPRGAPEDISEVFEDDNPITLNDVEREIAVLKSRNKIENDLNLPEDRDKRFQMLRLNVDHLNSKYQFLVRGKKGDADRKDLDSLEEETAHYVPSRFTKRGMAIHFFRKYARIILIVTQWISMIMNKQYDFEKELKSFVDIANEIEDSTVSSSMQEFGLTFDKKLFKANKEISLSLEARKILTTRWQYRTPEMIKQVINGLQSLKSLTEYPMGTQEKLCKVAWYQTIGAKKVIIRQGHHAESFYFILSGTAIVSKRIDGEYFRNVQARLTNGQSFGEIGLLFDTLRTATVESATPMELLVIGKEDFVRIFMKAENPEDDADHIKFLRKMSFMQHWPMEVLRSEPGACLTHYFKRGSLVTDNDRHSEWIYIIMSGTCEVLKKLKAVKARNPRDLRPKSDPMVDIILPELGMPHNCSKIDSGKHKIERKTINPDVLHDMTIFYENLRKKYQTNDTPPASELKLEEIASDDEYKDKEEKENKDIMQLPAISLRPSTTANRKYFTNNMDCDNQTDELFRLLVPSPEQLTATYRPVTKSLGSESSSKHVTDSEVFVQVELLHSKSTFGLNTLNYVMDAHDDVFDVGDHEIPILALVSRGAEVIMLSKKVFLKYANQKCRMLVRDQIKVFPSEQVMQDNMQNKADWDCYKSQLLTNYVAKKNKYKVKD